MIYHKPFDKQLFSQNDNIGRRNVIDMIQQKINVTLIPNTDKYGIDLLTIDKSVGVENDASVVTKEISLYPIIIL